MTQVVLIGANTSGTPKYLCRGSQRQFAGHLKHGQVYMRPRKKAQIVIEADELSSFVGSKKNAYLVWVVLDANTRLILGARRGLI